MSRRILLSFIAVMWLGTISWAQPKYVFYLIGDGMGMNSVLLTEEYLAAQDDIVGTKDLCWENFPIHNFCTTYSLGYLITDSGAAGTALSTGEKTNNKMIGMLPDGTKPRHILEMARDKGMQAGLVTSDELSAATPAAFSAHQKNRDQITLLQKDMIASGYDVIAGAKFAKTKDKDFNPEEELEEAGYTIIESRKDFDITKWKKGDKLLILPPSRQMPYAIDRPVAKPEKYLPAPDMLDMTVHFFMRNKECADKGFLIVAEGAHIDHCEHGNDAASMIKEVLDFEKMVKIACAFYNAHPDETLIVVTSDHETGGICLKLGKPESLRVLNNQTMSLQRLSGRIKNMMKDAGDKAVSWEEIKGLLRDKLGFWNKVELSTEEEDSLYELYENTVAKKDPSNITDPFGYNKTPAIIYEAVKLLDAKAGVYWGHRSHTAANVPVYVIGYGQDNFLGKLDNTDIAKKLMQICKLK